MESVENSEKCLENWGVNDHRVRNQYSYENEYFLAVPVCNKKDFISVWIRKLLLAPEMLEKILPPSMFNDF